MRNRHRHAIEQASRRWRAGRREYRRAVKWRGSRVQGVAGLSERRTRWRGPHMGLLEEAREDLKQANTLDPKNKAVRSAWSDLRKKFAEQSKQQKKAFGGTFDKASLFKDKPSSMPPSTTENPYAYLRIRATPRGSSEEQPFDGTIVLRVFADACPTDIEELLALCKGGKKGRDLGSALHYKGTPIHRIAKDFMIQGGDVHRRDGSSGESIYGRTFADEHFKLKFDKPGRLAMANRGKDCNHSQFFITCAEATHCNDSYVVFGEVVSGLEFVSRVASLDVDDKDAPSSYAVEIADSGLLSREEGRFIRGGGAGRPSVESGRGARGEGGGRRVTTARTLRPGRNYAPGWGEHPLAARRGDRRGDKRQGQLAAPQGRGGEDGLEARSPPSPSGQSSHHSQSLSVQPKHKPNKTRRRVTRFPL